MTDETALPWDELRLLRTAVAEQVPVDDARFDRLFPKDVRRASSLHWTPIDVALRAATLLARSAADRILDVGSGPGKLCVVGALTTPAVFAGVERRRRLVDVARAVADELEATRAFFWHGDMEFVDWNGFSGLYFYNPFGEHLLPADEQVDLDGNPDFVEHARLLRVAIDKLKDMPACTRIVTYHGLGSPLPPGYRHVQREQFPAGPLDLFIKEGASP